MKVTQVAANRRATFYPMLSVEQAREIGAE
jgi:hypothetical protein